MKGELVKTITKDGLELKGFWIDKKSDVAILHIHGTSGDFYTHEFIEEEAEKFSQEKISFLTVNNRGHDVYTDIRRHNKNGKIDWVQIGGAFEKFEDCLLDIQAWVDFLVKKGVEKIILQGHSLGPNKTVYYQYIKNNPKIVGQIHLSPCNDAGFMYYFLGEKKYKQTNKMIKKMIKDKKEKEMLPKELAVVCPMGAIAYHGYLTEEGAGNTFPYHNESSPKWKMLGKIKEPILAVFGEEDGFIKPSVKKAAYLLKKKAQMSKNTEVDIIKGASHSFFGQENKLVELITKWIKKTYL